MLRKIRERKRRRRKKTVHFPPLREERAPKEEEEEEEEEEEASRGRFRHVKILSSFPSSLLRNKGWKKIGGGETLQ